MTTPGEDPTGTPRGTDPRGPAPEGEDRSWVWKRGAFALFFLAAFSVAQTVQALIAVFQFLALLFTGQANRNLADFGIGLAQWLAETSAFLTAATERRPFPWSPWPSSERTGTE